MSRPTPRPAAPRNRIPGDHRSLAIPVPIPNTVVKQSPPMIVLMRESRLSPGSNKKPAPRRGAGFFHCWCLRRVRSAHGETRTTQARCGFFLS